MTKRFQLNQVAKFISMSPSLLLLIALVITVSNGQARTQRSQPKSFESSLSAQQIARKALPSVVLLICDDGDVASQASGFFIQPGVLVTNYHVIKEMVRGSVYVSIGGNRQKRSFRVARILSFDEDSDIALLNVPDAKKAGIPVLPLLPAGKKVEIGETIYSLGNPEGLIGTISPGIISAGLRSSKENARLQITAPVSHGSSGGPIVNTRGEVVGLVVGSISEGQNLNFAVPISLLSSLIRRTKIPNDLDNIIDRYVKVEGAIDGAWLWPEELDASVTTSSKPSPPPQVSIIGPLRIGESKEKASLRKLPGVHLLIEELDDDAKRILNLQQIQTEVELRLRRNRIRLLTEQEWYQTSGNPYLYLRLKVLQNETTGLYSYSYSLSLEQSVTLERDPLFQIMAATWARSNLGYAGPRVAASAIKEAIGEMVDLFCNDFLAAN